MLIEFTNATEQYKGNKIYINKNQIVAVFESPTDGGSLATIIYGGPQGNSWTVEEGLSKAISLINKGK